MEYEVITLAKAREFYATNPVDADVDISPFVLTREGADVGPVPSIAAAIAEVNTHRGDWLDRVRTGEATGAERNRFEAEMAGPIHEAFKDFPPEVLGDPDFWRYLGLGPLRWYTLTCDLGFDKEGVATLPLSSMETTTPGKLREHPVMRTFLRGQMCCDEGSSDPYADALIVGTAAASQSGGSFADQDVFKSHLIRVRAGNSPVVAQAFLRQVAKPYMPAGDARPFAKYFKRARTTRALELLSATEAAQLANNLRQSFHASKKPTP